MTNVTLWGLGAMGSGIAKLLRQRNIGISSVWEQDQTKIGRNLGEILQDGKGAGHTVQEASEVFDAPFGILIVATGSTVPEVFPLIRAGIKGRQHVITIAEEMSYPWAQHPKLAEIIDQEAKANGVVVLGTGINPGFILDSLVGFLTTPCMRVEHVFARRVNDLAPFGPTVLRTQGVGSSPAQFEQGLHDGSIVGHIGFTESIHIIGKMLGWTVDRIEQTRQPIISKTARETPYISIEPGQVCGCNHQAKGYVNGQCVISLEHPQQICPEAEGIDTGDTIEITGTPAIKMNIKPEVPGGVGTIATAVNVIPKVLEAKPGLRTMADIVLPSCWGTL